MPRLKKGGAGIRSAQSLKLDGAMARKAHRSCLIDKILLVSSADNFHSRSSYRLEQTPVANATHSTPSYSPDSKSHRHLSLNCVPEVEIYVVSEFHGMNAHP
jgi:hypothetical protein